MATHLGTYYLMDKKFLIHKNVRFDEGALQKVNYDSYPLSIHLLIYFTLFPYVVKYVYVCVSVCVRKQERGSER